MAFENILLEEKKTKLGRIQDFVKNKTELMCH